jgi:transcriptional regulator with XRE-family HTH domain
MGVKTGIKSEKGEMTATLANNLERAKDDLEISYRDLAQLTGISLKGIYNICEASQSPTVQTLEKICKSMRVSMNALLTPNASLDLMLSRRPERAAAAMNKMSADQQREAVAYLEAMVSTGSK